MRVIIIGGSKTVYFLTRQFMRRNYHVTILNRDPSLCRMMAQDTKATVVIGDGTDINRLEEAGARQADVFLALTNHDQDNLIACQLAKNLFGIPRTIALVNDPDNEEIFLRLGVTVAFSATRLIGSILDQETDFDSITAYLPLAEGRVGVTDVELTEDAPAIGKTLIELDLTDKALIACIIRDDEFIVPRGSTRLQINDHLLLISHPEDLKRNIETLCG